MHRNFAYCDLSNGDFFGMDLRGADFSHATLRKADFARAQLEQANLSYADLEQACFFEHLSLEVSALSPDGTLLATDLQRWEGDDGIRLWNVVSGQLERERIGHLCGARSLRFHPQGHVLAGGNSQGVIRLWDVAQGRLIREMRTPSALPVGSMAFHPNGKWLMLGDDVTSWQASEQAAVHILDSESGKLVGRFPGGVRAFTCQEAGEVLASVGKKGEIELWNLPGQQQLASLSCQRFAPGQIISLAFHPTTPTWLYVLLRAQQFSTVLLLDLSSRTVLGSLTGSVGRSHGGDSAISPSHMLPLAQESRLAMVGWGGSSTSVEIWDLLKRERLLMVTECGGDPLGLFADAADHRLVIPSSSGAFAVLDTQTGERQLKKPVFPSYTGLNIFGAKGLDRHARSFLLGQGAVEVEPGTPEPAPGTELPSSSVAHARPRIILRRDAGSHQGNREEAFSFQVTFFPNGPLCFVERYESYGFADTKLHYRLTIPASHVADFLALLAEKSHLPAPPVQENQPDTFVQQALQALIDEQVLFAFRADADPTATTGQAITTLEQWLEQAQLLHKRSTTRVISVHLDDIGPFTW